MVEEYDTLQDRWCKISSLPKALHHAGIGTINGRLYVIGGFPENLLMRSSVFLYKSHGFDHVLVEGHKSHLLGAIINGHIGQINKNPVFLVEDI